LTFGRAETCARLRSSVVHRRQLDAPVHSHGHSDGRGHSHGLVDRSILRSRAGIRAVSISLAVLTATALIQTYLYARTLSVALLADLVHNALTAIPLGLAFFEASEANVSPGCSSSSRSSSAPAWR
jgi:hypothetical protein